MHGIKTTMFAALVPLLFGIGPTAQVAEAGQVSIGITIGRPPAPRVVHAVPRRPGPEFVWVEGYWYPERGHYLWRDGYWARPPYSDAFWVAPRYERRDYFAGYWQAPRRQDARDRGQDHGRNRDYRDHDDARGPDRHRR